MPLYGGRPGVEISRELLEVFGHPEMGLRIIHIAGTNGKGTTAAYTAGILQAAGQRVGLYTSPHLVSLRERIRENGEPIGEDDFVRIAKKVKKQETAGELTLSDVLFVSALLFFREKGCETAVIETGLGGRLDSTAAVGKAPEVTVITRIGLDHTMLLGNTLPEIAAEKAGIIKKGTKVVLAEMDEAAGHVIEEKAGQLFVPVIYAADAVSDKILWGGDLFQLKASYLSENIRTAAAVTRLILPGRVWEKALRKGIAATRTPGRLEVLSEDPFVLFDGAHNPQGAAALADTLMTLFPGERFVFVIGCFARPQHEGMLSAFLPVAEAVFPVDIPHERNLGENIIAEYYKKNGITVLFGKDGDGKTGSRACAGEAGYAGAGTEEGRAGENRAGEDRAETGSEGRRGELCRQRFTEACAYAQKRGKRVIVCGSLHLYEFVCSAQPIYSNIDHQ